MQRSERFALGIIGAVVAIVFVCAGCVQAASRALYSSAGSHFGVAVYGMLDRMAPADFVEDTLAHAALARGDLDAAQRYAVRMPEGGRRSGVLAAIAAAHGQTAQAFEYAYVADDLDALQTDIMATARVNVKLAAQEEARVRVRLMALGTHPDAVAESYYTSGNLATWRRQPREALADYQAALTIAPLNMKYLISAATQAWLLHDYADAQRLYRSGLDVNPASGDALAGLGLVALHAGHRAQAVAYLARARTVDPNAGMIRPLAAALR
jgi:tetratricopeptide (TPR) repeat protein